MNATLNESKMPIGPHYNVLTEKVAIDCEMMRSNIGQVLGRVSVVNYNSEIIFDTFVYYPDNVKITNTDKEFSGIDWNDINPQNGAQPFSKVQTQLTELLCGRIVIGHDIQKDLKVISMDLSSNIQRIHLRPNPIPFDVSIRDTQKYTNYRQYANPGAHQGPSLKNLALKVLHRRIKHGQPSSVEDAIATMEVYRHAEVDIDREQGK